MGRETDNDVLPLETVEKAVLSLCCALEKFVATQIIVVFTKENLWWIKNLR